MEWGFQRAKAKTISKKSGFAYDFHQEGDFRGGGGKGENEENRSGCAEI